MALTFDDKPIAKKDTQKLDTLDDDGNFMQTRTRGVVQAKGFWHRCVHVWIIDLHNNSVLMQHRAASRKIFGDMWSCCTGHVEGGDPSLMHAKNSVEEDLKLHYPDSAYEFLFSCKEIVATDGYFLKQRIDVYALPLDNPPELEALAVDTAEADAVKYVTFEQLAQIYETKPPDHVTIKNEEYPRRLLRALRRICEDWNQTLPQEDSSDERNNKKAAVLLDTMDEDGNVGEPGRRGEVHRQSVWHRAVHVWLLDMQNGNVLLQQRSKKKRHFGGQWNCATGHVKVGESSASFASKSIKDDVGLIRFEEDEFDFCFQVRNEADTGGGCLLKQVVDVFCVSVPADRSYPAVPRLDSMHLARSEVDAVQYISIDDLEQIWSQGKTQHPNFVVPSNPEYIQRLCYMMRQKCRKYHLEAKGQTWPNWSAKACAPPADVPAQPVS